MLICYVRMARLSGSSWKGRPIRRPFLDSPESKPNGQPSKAMRESNQLIAFKLNKVHLYLSVCCRCCLQLSLDVFGAHSVCDNQFYLSPIKFKLNLFVFQPAGTREGPTSGLVGGPSVGRRGLSWAAMAKTLDIRMIFVICAPKSGRPSSFI